MIIGGVFTVALLAAGVVTTELTGAESVASTWAYNLGQLAAALFATLAAAFVVRRHRGRTRRGWLLVTWACASWTVGQIYWCYVELIVGEEMPEVSWADPLFLAFIVLMVIAVAPSGGLTTDRLRTLLDAFIIGASLFAISWTTSINEIAANALQGRMPPLDLLINLAYPIGDIVVLTMVILTASRREGPPVQPDGGRGGDGADRHLRRLLRVPVLLRLLRVPDRWSVWAGPPDSG